MAVRASAARFRPSEIYTVGDSEAVSPYKGGVRPFLPVSVRVVAQVSDGPVGSRP